MRRLLAGFCGAVFALQFLFMLAMVCITNGLIFSRYALSFSPAWSEEVTRYLMVWMVMLGGAVLTLFQDHITLYLVVDKLGPRGRALHKIVVNVVVCAVAVVTAWTGFGFALSMTDIRSPGSGLSMAIPTMSIPVSMVLIAAFAALHILRGIREVAGGRPGPLPLQSDYMSSTFKPAEDA